MTMLEAACGVTKEDTCIGASGGGCTACISAFATLY